MYIDRREGRPSSSRMTAGKGIPSAGNRKHRRVPGVLVGWQGEGGDGWSAVQGHRSKGQRRWAWVLSVVVRTLPCPQRERARGGLLREGCDVKCKSALTSSPRWRWGWGRVWRLETG